MVRAETEEASERDIDVQYAAAHLLDDQPLNCADVFILQIVDRSTLNPITLDDEL